jgi:AbrB family looped-hinge helix DNA binding protein
MMWARVLRSGQVTFPKEVRSSLNLKEGDILDFELKDSMVIVRPKTLVDKKKSAFWNMLDRMHEKLKDEDPEEIEKAIAEAIEEVRKDKTVSKKPRR